MKTCCVVVAFALLLAACEQAPNASALQVEATTQPTATTQPASPQNHGVNPWFTYWLLSQNQRTVEHHYSPAPTAPGPRFVPPKANPSAPPKAAPKTQFKVTTPKPKPAPKPPRVSFRKGK